MEETLKNLKASLTEIEESQNKKNIFETMKNIKTINLEFVNCDLSFREYEQ